MRLTSCQKMLQLRHSERVGTSRRCTLAPSYISPGMTKQADMKDRRGEHGNCHGRREMESQGANTTLAQRISSLAVCMLGERWPGKSTASTCSNIVPFKLPLQWHGGHCRKSGALPNSGKGVAASKRRSDMHDDLSGDAQNKRNTMLGAW